MPDFYDDNPEFDPLTADDYDDYNQKLKNFKGLFTWRDLKRILMQMESPEINWYRWRDEYATEYFALLTCMLKSINVFTSHRPPRYLLDFWRREFWQFNKLISKAIQALMLWNLGLRGEFIKIRGVG